MQGRDVMLHKIILRDFDEYGYHRNPKPAYVHAYLYTLLSYCQNLTSKPPLKNTDLCPEIFFCDRGSRKGKRE
jgi:hypothetical protein